MRESTIENYLVERVKAMGGEVRKVKWIGRHGAPDRLVMLPRREISQRLAESFGIAVGDRWFPGRIVWVELKAPGEKCRPHQIREHERMRNSGQHVVVVDSFEGVDDLLSGRTRPKDEQDEYDRILAAHAENARKEAELRALYGGGDESH